MSEAGAQADLTPEDLAEAAYRRGYQHGANDTLMAVERLLRKRFDFSDLRNWIGLSLNEWRHHDRVNDPSVQPPTPPWD